MSRLIVKNIPNSSTEDNLRKLFSEAGTLTEVQRKHSIKGKRRGFAFIGYHNESDADRAIKLFNNTFINTNKITVEKCHELKVKEVVKSGVKIQEKEKNETPQEIELLKKYKDDPMFEEFLQMHDPGKLEKLKELERKFEVDNKNVMEKETTEDEENSETKNKSKKNVQLYNVKLRNLPWEFKKHDIKEFFKPLKCFSIRMNQRTLRVAYVGFLAERFRNKALLKDKSYMKGSCVRVTKLDSNSNLSKSEEEKPENKKWKNEEETMANVELINESGRIFLRNLSYTTTEDDIENLFSKYGPISEVNLPYDSNTKIIKGFGTVTFLMPEHAAKAYSELDGSILHGRMLHLLPGKSKDSQSDDDNEESANYKQKKNKSQKANASRSHNWNALFVDPNAVAEVISERFHTTKGAIVGPDGKGSAPVKLALAETQIVAETKKYLEDMGVKLEAFDKNNVKRSKTVILVKNLPSQTTIMELREMFEKFGDLGRIVLPPGGLTGMIEFINQSDARKAFINLAYTKFKNVPLYLEMAPQGSLNEKVSESDKIPCENDNKKDNAIPDRNGKESLTVNEGTKDTFEENKKQLKMKPEPDTILCIKNLDPDITNDILKKHFEKCGEIYYAQVRYIKKKSTGIGFVRYFRKSSAEEALKTLQDTNLGSSAIKITKSDRTEDIDLQSSNDGTSTEKRKTSTIIVKNIPFEATSKEVENLFSTFGLIKTVRLPKKWNENGHRGFGFVEFATENDAKSAFEALSQSTHLLGRRLNLEWAKEDENVEETRKRTSQHFGAPKQAKKSKKSVLALD